MVVKINNSMKKEGKINTIGFDFLMVYDSYGIFVLSREMISEYLDESKDGVTATIPKYLVEKTFVRFPETDSIKPNKSYGEIKRKMMRDWLQDD